MELLGHREYNSKGLAMFAYSPVVLEPVFPVPCFAEGKYVMGWETRLLF